jgi:hypothetical protein
VFVLQRPFDQKEQVGTLERFREVGKGAQAHRLDGARDGAKGRDHNYGQQT